MGIKYLLEEEIGSIGLPNYESLKLIFDEKDLVIPSSGRLSQAWRYHKFLGYGDFIERFGPVSGLKDYCFKAQIVNYDQYRALIEGWNSHMWEWYTGVLIWKTQNPWTALRGMLYDPFLDQNGGFYGARKASEPVHIQFNRNDSTICLVNHGSFPLKDINCKVRLIDPNGKELLLREVNVNALPTSAQTLFKLEMPEESKGVYFLKLGAKDKVGYIKSENLYWISGSGKDLSDLNELNPVKLKVDIESSSDNGETNINIELTNPGSDVAFFTHLKLYDAKTEKRILPAFYSDNYITILPGETRGIKISVPGSRLNGLMLPELRLEGWNTPLSKFPVK